MMTSEEVWNNVIRRCTKPKEVTTKIQIGLLGKFDVGKTSITLKYADPTAELREKVKTKGTDIKTAYVSIYGETPARVKIWDTAGQEKHADIINSFVKHLDACFMVFDLTDRSSFEALDKWIT